MRLQSFYPIIVTEHLFACRDFYRRWFAMEVVFESTWFVLLSGGSGGTASLAFMHPGHPSAPPGPEAFSGKGMCLEFQVPDAAAEHQRFVEGAQRSCSRFATSPLANAASVSSIPRARGLTWSSRSIQRWAGGTDTCSRTSPWPVSSILEAPCPASGFSPP